MDLQQYQQIVKYLQEEIIPEDRITAAQQKSFKNFTKPYILIEEKLWRKTKWNEPVQVIQRGQEEPILLLYHDDPLGGHLGARKTWNKIRQRYFWPNMFKDIENYVKSCYNCQMQAVHRPIPREMFPIEPTGLWDRVGIDIIGPLELTTLGNRYIITAIDYFSRWPEAAAVPAANANEVAKFIYQEIICRHGIINTLHSDQGTAFINETIRILCQNFKIKYHQITVYHPQSNGLVERFNGTLKKTLMKISKDSFEWDYYIPAALFAYRNSRVDNLGTSPAMIIYGRTMRMPSETNPEMTVWERIKHVVEKVPIFRSNAKQHLTLIQQKQKEKQIIRGITRKFQVGDKVLVKRSELGKITKTFGEKWLGPYTVVQAYDYGTYVLEDEMGTLTKPINGDRMKLYYDRLNMEPIIVIEQETV